MHEVIVSAAGASGWTEQWERWLFLAILFLTCLGLAVSALMFKNAFFFMVAGLSWVGLGIYELCRSSSMGDVEQWLGALGVVIAFLCFACTLLVDWRAKREASKS